MDCNGLVEKIKRVNVCKALSLPWGRQFIVMGAVIIAIINTVDGTSCVLRCHRR